MDAVTVVIPTHNRRALLLRTLDTALHQQGALVQVVVVDDGGADGTTEAVRALGLANVRVVRHDVPSGVSAARNAGLALVETPWVAFVDDDDFWAPDKLAAQLAALAAADTARWSAVGVVHVDSDLTVLDVKSPPRSGDIEPQMLRWQAIPGGGSGVIVATELAREVGGFDEKISIAADWDFYLRLSMRSPVATVDRPLLAYYVHRDSMFHDPEGMIRELWFMHRKYADLPDGKRFRFERGTWYFSLARMAHQLGDRRTARRLLAEGLVRSRGALVIETARRVWYKAVGDEDRPEAAQAYEVEGWLRQGAGQGGTYPSH